MTSDAYLRAKQFFREANSVLTYLQNDETPNDVPVDVRFFDGVTFTTISLVIDYDVLIRAVEHQKNLRRQGIIDLLEDSRA